MPEYKYQPESGNVTSTLSVFEVYDPDTNTISNKKILKGESFYSDRYVSKDVEKKAGLIFIDDKPYISPILASFNGSGSNELEVPDYSGLVDIYISLSSGNVEVYFNNNSDHKITVYQSGTIFRSILTNKIRIVNTKGSSNYCIALLDSNQFTANNTTI